MWYRGNLCVTDANTIVLERLEHVFAMPADMPKFYVHIHAFSDCRFGNRAQIIERFLTALVAVFELDQEALKPAGFNKRAYGLDVRFHQFGPFFRIQLPGMRDIFISLD